MNNKKTILHFTLAVALIVGICITAKLRPASKGTSNYLSNFNQSMEIKDDLTLSKDSLDENQIGINDIQNNNDEENAVEIDVLCKDCENVNASDDVISKKTIEDIRYNFDVSSAEQVKEVQRILGLKEDGIFGPRTSEAYQTAISGETIKNKYTESNSKKDEQNPLSTTNAMLD